MLLFAQLYEDLVHAIDHYGAFMYPRASNEDITNNKWARLFHAAYHDDTGFARDFRCPTTKDRVSNFKNKIVDRIWPEIKKEIDKKKAARKPISQQEALSEMHMTVYGRMKKQAEQTNASKTVGAKRLQAQMQNVEDGYGLAPTSSGSNDSLLLQRAGSSVHMPFTQPPNIVVNPPQPNAGRFGDLSSAIVELVRTANNPPPSEHTAAFSPYKKQKKLAFGEELAEKLELHMQKAKELGDNERVEFFRKKLAKLDEKLYGKDDEDPVFNFSDDENKENET